MPIGAAANAVSNRVVTARSSSSASRRLVMSCEMATAPTISSPSVSGAMWVKYQPVPSDERCSKRARLAGQRGAVVRLQLGVGVRGGHVGQRPAHQGRGVVAVAASAGPSASSSRRSLSTANTAAPGRRGLMAAARRDSQ